MESENRQSGFPSTVGGESITESLETLDVKDSKNGSEETYVYIEDRSKNMDSPCLPEISIAAAEQWEEELMRDPKVLYSFPGTAQAIWN